MNYEKVRRKLDLKAIYGLMLSKMGLYHHDTESTTTFEKEKKKCPSFRQKNKNITLIDALVHSCYDENSSR